MRLGSVARLQSFRSKLGGAVRYGLEAAREDAVLALGLATAACIWLGIVGFVLLLAVDAIGFLNPIGLLFAFWVALVLGSGFALPVAALVAGRLWLERFTVTADGILTDYTHPRDRRELSREYIWQLGGRPIVVQLENGLPFNGRRTLAAVSDVELYNALDKYALEEEAHAAGVPWQAISAWLLFGVIAVSLFFLFAIITQ